MNHGVSFSSKLLLILLTVLVSPVLHDAYNFFMGIGHEAFMDPSLKATMAKYEAQTAPLPQGGAYNELR